MGVASNFTKTKSYLESKNNIISMNLNVTINAYILQKQRFSLYKNYLLFPFFMLFFLKILILYFIIISMSINRY